MNKRQRKKHGLLDQTIKIGDRVMIMNNFSGGHIEGTIGEVVDIRKRSSIGVMAEYKFAPNDKETFALRHHEIELKKLKNKGRKYFI